MIIRSIEFGAQVASKGRAGEHRKTKNGGIIELMRRIYSTVFLIAGCLMSVPAHATLLGLTTLNLGGSAGVSNGTNATALVASGIACPASFLGTTITAGVTPTIQAGGTIVGDTCNQRVSAIGGGSVTLREIVVREAGTGTLDFYIGASYTGAAGFGISRIYGVPFNLNPSYQVGTYSGAALLSSSGVGSPSGVVSGATKAAGGGFGGNGSCQILSNFCVTFDYSSLTTAAKVVVISTNDTLFTLTPFRGGIGADVGNGTTEAGLDTFLGYAPLPSAVPEPVSIVLTGTTLALSAFLIRRRRASSAKNELSVS